MSSKCPICNYELNEFDIFCSRCGYKIKKEPEVEKVKEVMNKTSDYESFLEDKAQQNNENTNKTDGVSQNRQNEYFSIEKASIFNNTMFNFIAYMIFIVMVLVVGFYIILSSQSATKDALNFKSMLKNPMKIPMLVEPSSFEGIRTNFYDIEKFLLMYMKYSKDTMDIKEQVFANYLNEINKLPNISQNLTTNEINECKNISSSFKAQKCTNKLNKLYSNIGIKAYSKSANVYLYPDYSYIKKTYSPYLSSEFKQYLALNKKYNHPSSYGYEIEIKPKKLADKIYDFEKTYNTTNNEYIKDSANHTLYKDFRIFIFNPAIYATTTQEMAPNFKQAYIYYINTKKQSALTPVIISLLDKQKAYNEQNFINDYPYQIHNEESGKNIESSMFNDIFKDLRNSMSQDSEMQLEYIYNMTTGSFEKYNKSKPVLTSYYLFSKSNENNNIIIYTNTYSPFQQLNIQRFSETFLVGKDLYILNRNRLAIYKVIFNGKTFNIQTVSFSDVTSLFPGIEVINIDERNNYNILLEKDNTNKNYIILSRYSQGFEDYKIDTIQGEVTGLMLPNMFSVNSYNDVIVSFHNKTVNLDETTETSPTYKFIIRTKGNNEGLQNSSITNFDVQTAAEQSTSTEQQKPNIMPKIENNNEEVNPKAIQTTAPAQKLDPPADDAE